MNRVQAAVSRILRIELSAEELEYETSQAEMREQWAIGQRWRGFHLDINQLSDEECRKLFRFTSQEVNVLVRVLCLEDPIFFRMEDPKHRFGVHNKLAMLILLCRLAYPCRLFSLAIIFHKDESTLSRIFNGMVQILISKFSRAMEFDENQFREENLRRFSKAIADAGSPFNECVGFIDGTFIRCARPTHDQELVYSGHYRGHGIKLQAVVTPDGITSSISKAVTGNRHDNYLYNKSGIEANMRRFFDIFMDEYKCFHLYGDAAYTPSEFMERSYKRNLATDDQLLTNKRMSKLRVSVENEFAHVGSLFAYLKFWRELKLGIQPVGAYYIIAILLKNTRVCLDGGNQTSKKFACRLPSLETYISSLLEQNQRMVDSDNEDSGDGEDGIIEGEDFDTIAFESDDEM